MYLFCDDVGVIAWAAVWLGLGSQKHSRRRQMHVWLHRVYQKTALLWAERNFKHPAASFSSGAWFLSAQAQSDSWLEARLSPLQNPETTRLDPQHVYTSLLMCVCHYPEQLCGLRGSRFILAAHLLQCLRLERYHFLLEINFNDGLIPINNTRRNQSLMSGLRRNGLWTWKSSLSAQVMAGDPFRYVQLDFWHSDGLARWLNAA